jgi:copper transport protein
MATVGRLTYGRRLPHRLALAAVTVSILAVAGLGLAAPASAHASLLFTTPSAGTAVPQSPAAISLIFDEPVTAPAHALTVTAAPSGTQVALRAATVSRSGTTVSTVLTRTVAVGVYTVNWQVVSSDGDNVSGSFQFAVGTGGTGPLSSGHSTTNISARLLTTAARWVQFLALALLLGQTVLPWLLRRSSVPPVGEPRPWACSSAAAGLLASLVLTALITSNDSLRSALLHPSAHALTSRPGTIAATETVAFAVALLIGFRWQLIAFLAALVVVGAEAIRAHPESYAGSYGTIVTFVHLAAAAAWTGVLIQTLRHLLGAHRSGQRAGRIVLAYSRIAIWLFAAVAVTGTLATVIIVPLHALTGTGYGLTLLVKIALLIIVAGIALYGRRRLLRAEVPRAALLRAETGLLVVILALSATLTTATPPRTATTALGIAPPALGPVVYLGTRAGQLGVTVAASAGQVIIRLFAPGTDAADSTDTSQVHYRLAATLTAPVAAETLRLHGCGPGCFVASAPWRPGTNQLALRASDQGWHGGSLTLSIPWPPNPDPAALTRLANALRHIGAMTDFERVTSDTTTGPGSVDAIPINGPQFLATEPYSNGRATAVTSISHPDGTSTLLLGYPDQNIYADLDLDATGRPVHEILTDPDHLITRTFAYPETH